MEKPTWREIFDNKAAGKMLADAANDAHGNFYDFLCHNGRIYALTSRMNKECNCDDIIIKETPWTAKDI
jgi:hypothetical protein